MPAALRLSSHSHSHMTKPRRRVSVLVRMNSQHQCTSPGCTSNRVALQPYCSRHFGAVIRNGHPTAGPVPERLWKPYRPRIRALLEANAGHPGLLHALRWLQHWMAQAEALDGKRRHAWATEAARLKRHGVTPSDILAELAACWCALQDHPRATVDDTHRNWAMGKAVLHLAPRPRRISYESQRKGGTGYTPRIPGPALRDLAPQLTKALAPVLANLRQTLEQEQDRAQAEAALMRTPLAPSRAAIERAVLALPSPTNQPQPETTHQ